ncbi:unnamed protein product [Moneuplotes crassus]|uniref:Kelch motif family protein n=1 Tax=Euplotes crassus TaxID=5936 RepID=A0AAD2DB31_EUPCR|nr:unnamed protein product [Moneuplotes crassus]
MIPLKAKRRVKNLTAQDNEGNPFSRKKHSRISHTINKSNLVSINCERNLSNENDAMLTQSNRQTVMTTLKGILKRTFKNNHIEDLKLHTLNYSQKNYLNKIIEERKSLIPFKMPHRDEESHQREIQYKQVTQSMAEAEQEKSQKLNKTVNKASKLHLPELSTNVNPQIRAFDKRFNSVKASKNKKIAFSRLQKEDLSTESPKNAIKFTSIKEALPAAYMKKKLDLKKTDDDEENKLHVKKVIKMKNPKQCFNRTRPSNRISGGKSFNMALKSHLKEEKPYLISVSPSMKNYDRSVKKQILRRKYFLNTRDEEFKIEEQYENRAAVQRVKYKNVWHPVFCQSATLTNLKGYSYLIGGVNHSVIKQVCRITDTDPEYLWKVEKDDEEIILQRYGHTCNLYKDSLVIFGGQRGSGSKKVKRIVLNDLWIYQPQSRRLEQVHTINCPDLRYGHCACIAGDYLVVYGGCNEMGDVLSDLAVLNLITKKWINVEIINSKSSQNPRGICFSRMVSIFYNGRRKNPENEFFASYEQNQYIDPYLPKSKREKQKDNDIILEGCYMFGGITDDNDIIGHLHILKIQEEGKKFEWEKVEEYNGKAPCERSHHFMEYFAFNNSILVFGGRNDHQLGSSVLNDMYFLQVDTLTWINVDFVNKNPASRFSHACGIQGSKLIIFGGVGSNFGMEQSVEIIEFDPEKFSKCNFTNILH